MSSHHAVGAVSDRICFIYDEIYSERRDSRFISLYRVFSEFAKTIADNDEILIDIRRLSEIIRSYFLEVIRYKEYHFNAKDRDLDLFSKEWAIDVHGQLINANKVAALTVKWILKYKPIFVNSSSDTSDSVLDSINEYYALQCALVILDIDIVNISTDKVKEIIYNFRFRNYEEGQYFMLLSHDYLTSNAQQ